MDDMEEAVGVADDHHVDEHQDGIGGMSHNIYCIQRVRLVVQNAPVDDGDADGNDQCHVVEPPVDFKGRRHVLNVLNVLW